ncbi:MAG TPA: gamma-glutamyltransferase, partial [Polyangiaceae bacterium]
FDACSGEVTGINGSGRAPAALTLERLHGEGFDELPPYHAYTVTVPGACAGWCDLIEKHGSLGLEVILGPAIRLADEGFPVAPPTSYYWRRGAERQLKSAPNGVELTINGRSPAAGEIFRNPGLARTFKKVAQGGKAAFYQGELAEAIAGVIRQAGGCLSLEDLAAHVSTWEAPISVTYRGYRVYECPPNGQGLAALIGLNILEGFDLSSLEPLQADRLHLEIEAMRLAFADARWYVSDPDFNALPIAELLSKSYAERRRKLIDPRRATMDQARGVPVASSDTVYFSVVDGSGNGGGGGRKNCRRHRHRSVRFRSEDRFLHAVGDDQGDACPTPVLHGLPHPVHSLWRECSRQSKGEGDIEPSHGGCVSHQFRLGRGAREPTRRLLLLPR